MRINQHPRSDRKIAASKRYHRSLIEDERTWTIAPIMLKAHTIFAQMFENTRGNMFCSCLVSAFLYNEIGANNAGATIMIAAMRSGDLK